MGLFTAFLLTLPWIFLNFFYRIQEPLLTSIFSGLCIAGGAYVLSFATEVAEIDFPKSFAFAILALVAVLPEYIVDFYFAWVSAKKTGYEEYALANMTGANRLLIGIGWPLILYLFAFKKKKLSLSLKKTLSLELRTLLFATLFAFLLPLKNTLSPFDGFFLVFLFSIYIYFASLSKKEEIEEYSFPGAKTLLKFKKIKRLFIVFLLFLYAGFCILISAEPFAEGLVSSGKVFGIDEFLLVQWVAPVASEAPEIIAICIFVLKGRPDAGFTAIVSSKVNQWTLLVGTLPFVYSISSFAIKGLPISSRQKEEIFLTAAQSFLALIILSDLDFNFFEATLILLLFLIQFFIPHAQIRIILCFIYIIIAFLFLLFKNKRDGFFTLFNIFKK